MKKRERKFAPMIPKGGRSHGCQNWIEPNYTEENEHLAARCRNPSASTKPQMWWLGGLVIASIPSQIIDADIQ